MARKTKPEIVAEQVAAAVGAGRKLKLESVDFSDPNRPKTCLEVDFPILPINQIAQIEGNAGKPIYQMSKWWARRRSSVFRSTLLAAAMKAPEDPLEASKAVWDAYYGNHQDNEAFKKLKVADIFMGGGTTLVEGSRLGMQMYGNDLNPVAWLVVKNELADVDIEEVKKLFDHIEQEVKPQIMPFYACEGPEGEKGEWTYTPTDKVMGEDFDPLTLKPEERKDYSYEGPEIIYTFWAKHGPCAAKGCGHRTPLMSSPVMAVKTLSVKSWQNYECQCGAHFDIERNDARMAPGIPQVIAETEKPFAIMDDKGHFTCPECGVIKNDLAAYTKGKSTNLGSTKNKKIEMHLLVHPEWLKGASTQDEQGKPYGGSVTDPIESTKTWNNKRASQLKLIEVRGALPDVIECPVTQVVINTGKNGGTIPKKSTFSCQEETCGRQNDVLKAIKETKKTGPVAEYALQCYSPQRSAEGRPYNGRYFMPSDSQGFNAALEEWNARKDNDLKGYWPNSELPYGFMTHHLQGGVPNHGFTHWWTMFNPRQLLVLTQLLKAIDESYGFSDVTKEFVLGVFQQYLRNQNSFCFWDRGYDKLVPHMSNNNYHPKSNVVENSVFSNLGRGNWASCVANAMAGACWAKNPWEAVSKMHLEASFPELAKQIQGKSFKSLPHDKLLQNTTVTCGSSTDLQALETNSYDLVITDPPFGGLLHYSELADFFYVWLRLPLKDKYPEYFSAEYTPKTMEAVANRARNPEDPDGFYKRLLTECWRESHRILKPSGLMSFTFHHSEDEPWVDVLESLFNAGFYLEATYPIRSDETKGQGEFGSKTIEYDIIHVCRKRVDQPKKISWPRLRRQIMKDVKQLQEMLEQHQSEGLPKADIQVIKRGKALEYFSKHYGQVYVEEGRDFTVLEALVGINQLLDDQSESEEAGSIPANVEPMTRQFLRIFAGQASVPRDQMQKYLRGSGMGPSNFVDRGWCFDKKKEYHWASALDIAQEWKAKPKAFKTDLDQALLLVGACVEGSGVNTKKILDEEFKPHPALGDLTDWFIRFGPTPEVRKAATVARSIYNKWKDEHKATVRKQFSMFDLEDAEV